MSLLRSLSCTVLATLVVACSGVGAESIHASTTAGTGIITGAGGSGGGLGSIAVTTTSAAGAGGQGGAHATGGPPYPFVLAHGFFGFDEFAGLDFETYYYHVKERLAELGEDVDTPAVDPFNSSDVRGLQLLAKVQDFIAQTGAAKVNIIGHSQGGLDARVVAHLRPDLVASVVTIGTPHHGSPVGDVAMKLVPDPSEQSVIDDLTQILGGALYDTIGKKTSLTAALQLFSQPGITAFNQNYPDAPGVFYASIAGRSLGSTGGNDCNADVEQPFITPWQSTVDPLNPIFDAFKSVLAGSEDYTHDGLVRVKDAKWGEYWGCLPADHVDEIGQILGENPGSGNHWGYLDFYAQLITYMRARGF